MTMDLMDTEFFAQRMQCSRKDKEDCLRVVHSLAVVAFTAQGGVRALDDMMISDWRRTASPFLIKAVQLYMDAKSAEQIRKVLYNTIISSGFSGPQFLESVIITEVIAALFDGEEDIEFTFRYLVPSFFGLEYERSAVEVYDEYRRSLLQPGEGG